MQFFQITSVVALLGALATAVPTPADTAADTIGSLKARAEGFFKTYSSDHCTTGQTMGFWGPQSVTFSTDDREYSCLASFTNERSIFADTRGCKIRTWSGKNCRGNSYTVKNGCNSVLIGSLSIQC